jgi:hypothetical protein
MRKPYYLFTLIILAGTTIAFSQTIPLKEINKRILQDSATYSWERVNEIANGLENERKLVDAYGKLENEKKSLTGAYLSLEKRFLNYQDTIVPAYQEIIVNKDSEIKDISKLFQSSETLLGKQRFKKWWWAGLGIVIGVITGVVLSI